MKKLTIILAVLVFIVLVFLFIFRDTKSTHEYEKYASQMKSFETDTGSMKYHESGTGQLFLLLHGFPTSSWMYRDLASKLSQSGYRVMAVDMIGFENKLTIAPIATASLIGFLIKLIKKKQE